MCLFLLKMELEETGPPCLGGARQTDSGYSPTGDLFTGGFDYCKSPGPHPEASPKVDWLFSSLREPRKKDYQRWDSSRKICRGLGTSLRSKGLENWATHGHLIWCVLRMSGLCRSGQLGTWNRANIRRDYVLGGAFRALPPTSYHTVMWSLYMETSGSGKTSRANNWTLASVFSRPGMA